MRAVGKYKQHAEECRELAAKTVRPDERKILEGIAKAWEKLAGLREHDLVEADDARH
jgi:hypothetical protein